MSDMQESERRRRAVVEWLFDQAESLLASGAEMLQGALVVTATPKGYRVRVWEETTEDAMLQLATAATDERFWRLFGVDLAKARREQAEQRQRGEREHRKTHPYACERDPCAKMDRRYRTERGLKMHLAKTHGERKDTP